MDENIQTIKIDEDGKYIILVEFPDEETMRATERKLLHTAEELCNWWKSDNKFYILAKPPDNIVKVRFEKVGDE